MKYEFKIKVEVSDDYDKWQIKRYIKALLNSSMFGNLFTRLSISEGKKS